MKSLFVLLFVALFTVSCEKESDDSLDHPVVAQEDIVFVANAQESQECLYTEAADTVVFLRGFINAKQPVSLIDPTLAFSVQGGKLSDFFSVVYLQIGTSVVPCSLSVSDSKAFFEEQLSIKGSVPVKVYAFLRKGLSLNTIATVKFDSLDLLDFVACEYGANGEPVVSNSGSIPGVAVTLDMSK